VVRSHLGWAEQNWRLSPSNFSGSRPGCGTRTFSSSPSTAGMAAPGYTAKPLRHTSPKKNAAMSDDKAMPQQGTPTHHSWRRRNLPRGAANGPRPATSVERFNLRCKSCVAGPAIHPMRLWVAHGKRQRLKGLRTRYDVGQVPSAATSAALGGPITIGRCSSALGILIPRHDINQRHSGREGSSSRRPRDHR
jgi:hypothetical protein